MKYQKFLELLDSLKYLSVGLDVGADFTWMSIARPDGSFIGKPYKILHDNPQSRELAVQKIKEAQEMSSLESRCFLESTGIYHIPLLCYLRDKGFACETINPIITKNSTNMNIRKLHNDKFDSKKAALVGLNTSLKVSIIPENSVIDLRNLVRDYYYIKDQQSSVVLKLNAELKVSFPKFLNVFSKITTKCALKILKEYPLAKDVLSASKDDITDLIRSTARFGDKYASDKYTKLHDAAVDAGQFGRALPSSAIRIKLYIDLFEEYQQHLDEIMQKLQETVENLKGTAIFDRIALLQTFPGIGFMSATVLIAEMGSFDLFSSPKKLYAYFGLDPAVKQSGKFVGDKVHMSKRGSALARRLLHMIALNNLKMDKTTKEPVNQVIHDYYELKCKSKKKNVAVGAVMHKVCNIIFAMLRDNAEFVQTSPEDHCKTYEANRRKLSLAA